jgi:hypothetical protein
MAQNADFWVKMFKGADKNADRVRIGDLKRGYPYPILSASSKFTQYGEVVELHCLSPHSGRKFDTTLPGKMM